MGLYKLIWSNEHSWMRKKKLRYRICVLRPMMPGSESKNMEEMEEEKQEPQDIKQEKVEVQLPQKYKHVQFNKIIMNKFISTIQ